MKVDMKRGSIDLARRLCYEIAGPTDDNDDISGSGYGSVDIAEILSAEVERLRALMGQASHPVAWMLECQTMGGDTEWRLSWSKSGAGLCTRLHGESHEKPLYTYPSP